MSADNNGISCSDVELRDCLPPSVTETMTSPVPTPQRQASVVSVAAVPVVSPSPIDDLEKLLKIRSYEEPSKDSADSNDCAFSTLLIDPQQRMFTNTPTTHVTFYKMAFCD